MAHCVEFIIPIKKRDDRRHHTHTHPPHPAGGGYTYKYLRDNDVVDV